jgi:phage baseplate assembly protein W
MADDTFLGEDLDLGFVADEQGRVWAGPPTRADLQARRRSGTPPAADLATVRGVAALVQSLIVRLLTEQGELAPLGEPAYGSRHHRLIGEPNSAANRALVRLYVLDCLRQEARLEAIHAVTVDAVAGRAGRDQVLIRVEAQARGAPGPINFVVPFSFGGEVA